MPQKKVLGGSLQRELMAHPTCIHYDLVKVDDKFDKIRCQNPVEGGRGNGFLCKTHQDLLIKKISKADDGKISAADILRLEEREIASLRTSGSGFLSLVK